MPHFKIGFLSVIATCAAVVGGAAAADASSTTVAAAIRAQDKTLVPGLDHWADDKAANDEELSLWVMMSRTLRMELDRGAVVVSAATAVGPKQKQGQNDWVEGVRQTATGVGMYGDSTARFLRGDQKGVNAEMAKAKRMLDAGEALTGKGDKLLGLPWDD